MRDRWKSWKYPVKIFVIATIQFLISICVFSALRGSSNNDWWPFFDPRDMIILFSVGFVSLKTRANDFPHNLLLGLVWSIMMGVPTVPLLAERSDETLMKYFGILAMAWAAAAIWACLTNRNLRFHGDKAISVMCIIAILSLFRPRIPSFVKMVLVGIFATSYLTHVASLLQRAMQITNDDTTEEPDDPLVLASIISFHMLPGVFFLDHILVKFVIPI